MDDFNKECLHCWIARAVTDYCRHQKTNDMSGRILIGALANVLAEAMVEDQASQETRTAVYSDLLIITEQIFMDRMENQQTQH